VGLPQSVKLLTATKVGQPLELIVIEASTFRDDITPISPRFARQPGSRKQAFEAALDFVRLDRCACKDEGRAEN
jgi:hypothetical protein